jgi:hypothetical protein
VEVEPWRARGGTRKYEKEGLGRALVEVEAGGKAARGQTRGKQKREKLGRRQWWDVSPWRESGGRTSGGAERHAAKG